MSQATMFVQVERDFSLGSWVCQMVLAYIAPLLLVAILESWLMPGPDTPVTYILDYFLWAGAAALIALAVFGLFDEAAHEGASVWILPCAFLLFGVLWDSASFGVARALREFFFPRTGMEAGEAGIAMLLVTLPVWGCVCYSAVMYWRPGASAKKR